MFWVVSIDWEVWRACELGVLFYVSMDFVVKAFQWTGRLWVFQWIRWLRVLSGVCF